MFGSKYIVDKKGRKILVNPPSAKAKAAEKRREFVRFVKSFAIDYQKPATRGWAAKRILHEANKLARA